MWGRNVVRELAARGVPVRAFVRDPDKACAMLGDRVDLRSATSPIPRPSLGPCTGSTGCSWPAATSLARFEYECAVIDAASGGRGDAGGQAVRPRPALDSPLIFDRWHARSSGTSCAAGLPSVMLRPRTYMTNLLGYAGSHRADRQIFAPAGAARISFMDPRDVAAAAAAALTADEPLSEIVHTDRSGVDRIRAGRSRAVDGDGPDH